MKKIIMTIITALIMLSCSTFEDITYHSCGNEKIGGCEMKAKLDTPKIIEEKEKVCSIENKMIMEVEILFEFDKYDDYKVSSNKDIDELVENIKKYKDKEYVVYIIGHTDRFGSEEYNYNLGNKRALEIANIIEGKGMSKENIVLSSMGEIEPKVYCEGNVATNKVKKCLEKNRRIEIKVYEIVKECK